MKALQRQPLATQGSLHDQACARLPSHEQRWPWLQWLQAKITHTHQSCVVVRFPSQASSSQKGSQLSGAQLKNLCSLPVEMIRLHLISQAKEIAMLWTTHTQTRQHRTHPRLDLSPTLPPPCPEQRHQAQQDGAGSAAAQQHICC